MVFRLFAALATSSDGEKVFGLRPLAGFQLVWPPSRRKSVLTWFLVRGSWLLIAASRWRITNCAFTVAFGACDRRAIELCAVIGHSVPSWKNPANACGSQNAVVVEIVGLELYLFHIV